MQINRVFDMFGPDGFIPNGWNYKYTDVLWEHNFLVYNKSIDDFNKKYGQISVYDCNLNLPDDDMNIIHISDLNYDENTNTVSHSKKILKNNTFFYTIHPFGDISISLGLQNCFHENTTVLDNISLKCKNLLKADNFYIIFDYSSEGDIKPNIFYSIHSACERNGINPSKIIFISSALNTFDIYNDFYIKENNPINKLYTAVYPWSFLAKAKDTHNLLYESDIVHFNDFKHSNSLMSVDELKLLKNRSKKSICLNRRLATHRIILLSFLMEDGYFDNSLFSYDIDMLFSEDVVFDLIHGKNDENNYYINSNEFKQKALNGFRKLKKKQKSIIDYEDIKNVWGFAFENKQGYMDTYFSIVTETLFYEEGNYISEKTWKPIAHLHPFILVGRPGTLKFLKHLGFKTFSDFWDESYDDIENNYDRISKVYEVICSLLNKSNDEWDIITEKMIPILEYNRNLLVSTNEKDISNRYVTNLFKLLQNEPNQETHFLL